MTKTILVIDDSPTEIQTLKQILKSKGYSISCAENAIVGIKQAKELMPDIILMDVVMPGMNGFQATRKISRDPSLKDIPVIILTTKDQQTDILWGKRQGAKGYLVKPVEPENLLREIKKLLSS